MKKKALLLVAISILFFLKPVFGERQGQYHLKESEVVSSSEAERVTSVKEAHKMMGHINLAYLALDIDLPNDAVNHIDKARELVGQLKADVPSLSINSTLKYGKVSYTARDTIKNYYVPVLDDLFLLSEYDTVYRHLQSIDLKQTDARVVELDLLIDLQKITQALETAKQELTQKKYQQAQMAFAEIFQDAIVDEMVITDARVIVYDNLALAKNFIQNGLYPDARFALKNVKKGLAQLEKEKMDSSRAQQVQILNKEITQLDTNLEKKDPTLIQRVGSQFSVWMKTAKSWF